jgi:prepilin-type N-terminal cleavage/methylation domain-containing protein
MSDSRLHSCRGLSLVEVLITVSICSTLMVAVAMAFQATASAVEINERFVRSQQAARVTLTQIMAEARKCRSGTVDSGSFEIVTALGDTRTYAYDPAEKQITMTLHTVTEPWPVYVLARNVSAAEFSTDQKTIALTLTVDVSGNTATLAGSALPRKALTYQ